MSELTRDLLGMVAARVAMFPITLNFSTKVKSPKGYFISTPAPQTVMADVVDLSEDEIKRLQSGGITINDGIKVTIPSEFANIPETITYGQDTYTVLDTVIAEGTTVFSCSRKSLGTATPEPGA